MTPDSGPEATSMDQAAGEAIRMAAELVAVGTMAVAQGTRRREAQAEQQRQQVLKQTREATRQERPAGREQPQPGDEAPDVVTAPDAETQNLDAQPEDTRVGDHTEELPVVDVDSDATAPIPAIGAEPESGREELDNPGYDKGYDDPDAEDNLLPVHQEAAVVRARAAGLATTPGADPATLSRALVDVGAQPAQHLSEAVARQTGQPRPTRSSGLGRSPLPGHDLSR